MIELQQLTIGDYLVFIMVHVVKVRRDDSLIDIGFIESWTKMPATKIEFDHDHKHIIIHIDEIAI